jgi:hypothetical protein
MCLYQRVVKGDGIKVLIKLMGKTVGIIFIRVSRQLREIDPSRQGKKQG